MVFHLALKLEYFIVRAETFTLSNQEVQIDSKYKIKRHWSTNTPAFRPKIVYFYVIEVNDSESDLGLFSTALVSKIFAFNHLLEYARGGPGSRGHVHLGQNVFEGFEGSEGSEGIEGFDGFEGFVRYSFE